MHHQPDGVVLAPPGIRVNLSNGTSTGMPLDVINTMELEALQGYITQFKHQYELQVDFDNLPERG
jgi:hypothetical protein